MEEKNNEKKQSFLQRRKGFTLIELLVVIAIIGVLASVVLASLNTARLKARDARRISDFKAVQTALAFYFDKYGKYPNETPVVTNPWYDNFNNMAQQLVNEGFLSSIPQDPSSGNAGYNYYNYLGPTIGALLVVNLETVSPTTVGPYGSCRPFGANWCSSTQASANYCLCNPY